MAQAAVCAQTCASLNTPDAAVNSIHRQPWHCHHRSADFGDWSDACMTEEAVGLGDCPKRFELLISWFVAATKRCHRTIGSSKSRCRQRRNALLLALAPLVSHRRRHPRSARTSRLLVSAAPTPGAASIFVWQNEPAYAGIVDFTSRCLAPIRVFLVGAQTTAWRRAPGQRQKRRLIGQEPAAPQIPGRLAGSLRYNNLHGVPWRASRHGDGGARLRWFLPHRCSPR